MAKPKDQSYSLLDLYSVLFAERYGKKPIINRYRDRWGFSDMIDSIGYDLSVEVTKFYFRTNSPGHKLPVLFSTFDKMVKTMQEIERDRERRSKIRVITGERVERWEGEDER